MTEWPPADPTETSAVAEQRDALLASVRDHAGRLAYELAKLEGGDYGQRDFQTDRGTWTVKYEGGDLEYLRFDPTRGREIYVISTKQPPEPAPLTDALQDYDAFVRRFNDYVASLDGVVDDVSTDFPDVESTDGLVAQRDRVLDDVRDVCRRIADQLRRFEGGEYGTFSRRVSGTRWELKWDEDGVSYLRAGGSGGVYLISQYDQPTASEIREYVPQFAAFVAAYNEYVADLEADLQSIDC